MNEPPASLFRSYHGSRPLHCVCETCGEPYKRRHSSNAGRFCCMACVRLSRHSPEFIAECAELWATGLSARLIGARIGKSKNAVVGIADRNGFPPRPSPIKRYQTNMEACAVTESRPDIVVKMSKPPSTNKLWSRGAGGRRVRSPAYKAWLTIAGWEVKRQIIGMAPLACRFNLTIEVPISRRDSDNWAKPISDLCEHVGVVTNDGNMHMVTITPTERDDCMAAFFSLPDMDGVRKPAKPRFVSRAWKPKNKPGVTWKL